MGELESHLSSGGADNAPAALVHPLAEYLHLAYFHHQEAYRQLGVITEDGELPSTKHLALVLGQSEHQEEFAKAIFAARAHMLAYAHAVRAIFDVFGFLVNEALLKPPFPASKCSIQKVVSALPQSPLESLLVSVLRSDDFRYLTAFINTSKHRVLVSQSFVVSPSQSYVGIQVEKFRYNEVDYQACRAREFLGRLLALQNRIVECGVLLNKAVVHAGEQCTPSAGS